MVNSRKLGLTSLLLISQLLCTTLVVRADKITGPLFVSDATVGASSTYTFELNLQKPILEGGQL